MLHRASEGGVSSSPLLPRARDKQVEYLDLDLHTGRSTPPRQVTLFFLFFSDNRLKRTKIHSWTKKKCPKSTLTSFSSCLVMFYVHVRLILYLNNSLNILFWPETLYSWRGEQWQRWGQDRRGARAGESYTCGLRGGGPQKNQGPEEHQRSMAWWKNVHREGKILEMLQPDTDIQFMVAF